MTSRQRNDCRMAGQKRVAPTNSAHDCFWARVAKTVSISWPVLRQNFDLLPEAPAAVCKSAK